jgi:hypothetical protein
MLPTSARVYSGFEVIILWVRIWMKRSGIKENKATYAKNGNGNAIIHVHDCLKMWVNSKDQSQDDRENNKQLIFS